MKWDCSVMQIEIEKSNNVIIKKKRKKKKLKRRIRVTKFVNRNGNSRNAKEEENVEKNMYKYGRKTGERTLFLIQRVHCYTRRRAWISRTRWNSFFPIRERDAWRRSASREAWFIGWHRTDQYRTPCIFNEAGRVPVDDAHRDRFQLQMRPGMRSVVTRQLDACTREIDRPRRNSFFLLLAILHTFSPTDSVLMGGR